MNRLYLCFVTLSESITMNHNTAYEIFIRDIYQQILNQDTVENIEVKHNQKIQGKSGATHQVDVYWQYKQFGETVSIAIECKRYSKKINIGIIRNFKAVLDDLSCSKGIIVTTEGFQTGAIKFASSNNIGLKVIRTPKKEDLQGIPKHLTINGAITPVRVNGCSMILDKDWCIENIKEMNEDFSDSLTKLNVEIILVDRNGQRIDDMLSLEDKLPVKNKTIPSKDNKYEFRFEEAYILHPRYNLIKVSEIHFNYDIEYFEEKRTFDIHSDIKAVMYDIITGEKRKFIR